MDVLVTRGKTSAECGYVSPDPRVAIAAIRHHIGVAEGHLVALYALLRELEENLTDES